jgi:DNA-binding NtrC family response regulator
MADTRPTDQQDDSARRLGRGVLEVVAHLSLVHGSASRVVFQVQPTGTVMGRDTDDICVNDQRISRRHARIERAHGAWQLLDLGSKNGGYLDGRTFASHARCALSDGAVIRLGDSVFVFRAAPAPKDADVDNAAFPGSSALAATVRRRIAQLAAALGHALVLGETGTGKERVARAIAGGRKPFIAQNCGELGAELARSELFGHVQGAFSGATQAKPGLIDAAGDGALFLDEVGELSLEVQVDLLRFLEDGSYRPVGGQKVLYSKARVVAATNVDLDHAVATGRFRRDLAARLRASNAPLELPALRDRREDVAAWARRFAREAGLASDALWTAGALECLLVYPWPENLRELRGVVRTLVVDGGAPPWSTEQLPERIYAHRGALRGPREPEAANGAASPASPPPRDPTRAAIEDALKQTGGTMQGAAKLLGVERTKLYRLCRELAIEPGDYRS